MEGRQFEQPESRESENPLGKYLGERTPESLGFRVLRGFGELTGLGLAKLIKLTLKGNVFLTRKLLEWGVQQMGKEASSAYEKAYKGVKSLGSRTREKKETT